MENTLAQINNLLQTTKSGLKGKNLAPPSNALILSIGQGKWKKRKAAPKGNWKNKAQSESSSNWPKAKSNPDILAVNDPK